MCILAALCGYVRRGTGDLLADVEKLMIKDGWYIRGTDIPAILRQAADLLEREKPEAYSLELVTDEISPAIEIWKIDPNNPPSNS